MYFSMPWLILLLQTKQPQRLLPSTFEMIYWANTTATASHTFTTSELWPSRINTKLIIRPCTKNVDWYILSQPIRVQSPVIKAFQKYLLDQDPDKKLFNTKTLNARAIQAIPDLIPDKGVHIDNYPIDILVPHRWPCASIGWSRWWYLLLGSSMVSFHRSILHPFPCHPHLRHLQVVKLPQTSPSCRKRQQEWPWCLGQHCAARERGPYKNGITLMLIIWLYSMSDS
jgi:hypothetical protein